MSVKLLSAIAACALTLAFAAMQPLTADVAKLPERKAGLWELKTSMDEGMGPRENSMKLCIGAQMEANTVLASMEEHKRNCSKYEIKTSNGITTVDASCNFNDRLVSSTTEMSGDFQKTFSVTINSTTSDQTPGEPRTIVVKRTIKQQGTYLGESCGDVAPGQAITPDGSKVMVQ